MRAPTENQAARLRVLGNGAIVLAPGRRDWGPLLRRGWVEPVTADEGKRFLPPLRITPAGLRALAVALERDGHPDPGPMRQVDEPPSITRLKGELEKAREAKYAAEREAGLARSSVARARRALDGLYV